MDGGSHTLLHCLHGTLNFTNVLVGSRKIETDAQEVLLDFAELIVTMNGNDRETSCVIKVKDFGKGGANGLAAATGHKIGGTELNFSRNGVEKSVSLNKKEINGEDDVAMMLEDSGRYCNELEVWDVGRSASRGLSFEGSKVGAVDVRGSPCIVGGNRTVTNEMG